MAKKSAPARKKKPAAGRNDLTARRRFGVVTTPGDHFAAAMQGLPEHQDSDRYLNVVQWNIERFGAKGSAAKDKLRRQAVLDVLTGLNADLFVLQEVAGPSSDGRYPGVLDSIAEELTQAGTGDYVVFYTKAGGEQRVAI